MSSSIHNPSILLKRIFNLTESSSFILCIDSMAQTSHGVINEFIHHRNLQSNSNNSNSNCNNNSEVIYIAFNSINRPEHATYFINIQDGNINKVSQLIQSSLPPTKHLSSTTTTSKSLVIIDSLNYLNNTDLSQFIGSIASPSVTIIAIYHRDVPESLIFNQSDNDLLDNYPSSLELLQFMATTILEISPILPNSVHDHHELSDMLEVFNIPRGLNNSVFSLLLVNRRKSGRSLKYNFQIDSKKHEYILMNKKDNNTDTNNDNNSSGLETPEMLQGLTTFNLTTSEKQKRAKEQVNLPFLEAQQYGSSGGAIVYEYEKDDDYDEEDPYEDPF
ncbi:Elongator subunit IKI1 PWA37_001196 [Arxiozyma heterogenica]|uniref:Elongator complex protein 5 n=1 Tax=Arxiozyma heterogenica TaxID=278026 RepID=A0AAN7WSE0_9SACH|nr:hypothetical protein RI543_003831 [Kazachstania heterogenica]